MDGNLTEVLVRRRLMMISRGSSTNRSSNFLPSNTISKRKLLHNLSSPSSDCEYGADYLESGRAVGVAAGVPTLDEGPLRQ